jgi:EmrB/QacA subfamily drug resistance transporter
VAADLTNRETGGAKSAKRQHPVVILSVILACQMMVVLDGTIVTIALPQIRESLAFSTANLSWVLNAYTLTFGGLLLLGARAGDILGRRTTFVWGIALFTAASLLGGLAQSPAELLIARAAQGVGGAIASPSALALLMTMFAEGRARNRALGLYTAVSVSGGAVGLIAGGMLVEWVSWRWVMFVNVPIGIALLLAAATYLVETPRQHGRFDLAGALTSSVGMASLVYGFVHAAAHGWSSTQTLAAFGAGLVLMTTFVWVETRAEAPITPLSLFADRQRSGAYLARMLLIAGMTGMFFFLTLFLQDVLGYSSLQTGFGFLPITASLFLASQTSARILVERFGESVVMIAGITLSTVGMLWLSRLGADSGYLSVLGPLVLVGLGNGTAFVPLTSSALHGVEMRYAGAASGLVNVMQQMGAALGLAVLVTIFGSASRAAASTVPPGSDLAERARLVFVAGTHTTFTVAAALLLGCLAVVVLVVRPKRVPSSPEVPVRA